VSIQPGFIVTCDRCDLREFSHGTRIHDTMDVQCRKQWLVAKGGAFALCPDCANKAFDRLAGSGFYQKEGTDGPLACAP